MTTAADRRRLPAPERRARILQAARGLFAEHGYDATTTRQIATAAGVTDAIIYRHFPSKQDLLRSLVDELTATFAAMAPARRAGGTPTADDLRALGDAFADAFAAHLDLVVLMIAQRHVLGGEDRLARFVDGAATGLGRALSPTDPEHGYLLARGYMGAIASFALLQRSLGLDDVHPVDVRDYVAALAPRFADRP